MPTARRWTSVAILIGCCGLWPSGASPCRAEDPGLDEVLVLLERQELLLLKARIRFSERTKLTVKGSPVEQTIVSRTASQGAKLRSEMEFKTSKATVHSIDAFDGERHYAYKSGPNKGTVASQGAITSNYSQHIYNAKTGLATELRAVRDTIKSRWVDLAGERLLLLEWTDPADKFDNLAWLNPKAEYQPRLIQRKTKFAAPRSNGTTGMTIRTQVKDYVQDHGAYFPSKVDRTLEIAEAGGKIRRDEMNFELLEIESDVAVPDAEFVLKYPPGARIFDADSRLHYVVGEDGNWERSRSPVEEMAELSTVPWWANRWLLWPIVLVLSAIAAFAAWRQFRLAAAA